ncbi:MAG: nucleotidyltransferase domain-containing protein [Nanoarchaeota archaeon]
MKEVNLILKEQLKLINPSEEDLINIKKISREFQLELSRNLKKNKIKADFFLGGSLAKNTLVNKNVYDIDIFVRFDKYYKEEISDILGKLLKNVKRIHGSRDYYQKNIGPIIIEVIPVIKIKKPEQALNVTDLSYFHVNYILKKIKQNKRLENEIKLGKAFAHAQNVYGAESYINGFSGYAIELLVVHYKTFLNLLKAIVKLDLNNKLIIDQEKLYKNKEEVLVLINHSKILSPIILIDPTFKERNALSSLSYETLNKFQKSAKLFLKNPSKEFFIQKKIEDNFRNVNTKIIQVKTNKQRGDIAGTKTKKFYNFLLSELRKEFNIKKEGFEYSEKEDIAKIYLILKNKKPTLIKGPPIKYKKNLEEFKNKHKNVIIRKNFPKNRLPLPKSRDLISDFSFKGKFFGMLRNDLTIYGEVFNVSDIKNNYAYTILEHNFTFEEWINNFKKNNLKIIREMGIIELELVK